MYLRFARRRKDGKEHRYWSIVESRRCAGGRVVQRPILYLGEINDGQREAWCRQIEAFDEASGRHRQLALFSAERAVPDHAKGLGVQVRLDAMELHRPRQWGACWLACHLYKQLELDRFFAPLLPDSREGTNWQHILQTLVCYRLIDPGSEWRLHRQWFYIQLVEIEAAFKTMKDDLQLRPIHHQLEHRIEAHIFVAFLAYCLHVTLRARLKPLAPGLTPRAVLDKFAAIQMLDVRFPTTDGRTLILSRYTELTADQKLLARHLKLDLPPQPPPRITAPEKIARLPANAV